jgi:hypothetical protein
MGRINERLTVVEDRFEGDLSLGRAIKAVLEKGLQILDEEGAFF